MRIHGDGYKLFSVLNSIFFLYSWLFSSDVNSCLWITVFSLKQAILWFVSAGHENTAECMTGVREKYCSQPHEAFRIKPQVCHSLCKLFLPVLSQRWLPKRPAVCVGTGGGEEQGRRFVLCVVGCWCCQKRRQFICSGGFGTTCEPLCCVSQILFFNTEEIVRILFRH